MRKAVSSLLNEIIKFVKSDFHFVSYLYTFVFIAASIYFNYTEGFYRNIIRNSYFEGNSTWVFPLFYASVYFAVAIPTFIFRKDFSALKHWSFYVRALFFIGIYGFSIGFYSYRGMEFPSLFDEEAKFIIRILSQLKSLFFYFIPLILLKKFVDKKTEGLYGLSKNTEYIKGYFSLFLMLLPFLVVMSFTPDFQSAYPQFKPWLFDGIFGLKTWQYTSLFELSYAIDFVMTELLFRGALVIGMVAVLGRKAILPMVAMYVCVHFGKPLGETISSVFGGFMLGALAYQTRHIWGGVIVHILIALSMEIMGIIHFYNH